MDLLWEVARAMPESLNANMIVTGDGTVIAGAKRKAAKLGVDKKVVFLGRIPQQQMPALYRAYDLVLYISPIESFEFPLLERARLWLANSGNRYTTYTRDLWPRGSLFQRRLPGLGSTRNGRSTGMSRGDEASTKMQFDSRDGASDLFLRQHFINRTSVTGRQVCR